MSKFNKHNDMKSINSKDSKNKYQYLCKNCGKYGHNRRQCTEPATSYGIISIKFMFDDDFNEIVTKIFEDFNNKISDYEIDDDGLEFNDLEKDKNLIMYIKNRVKFLMVQRKHTIGFLEFMRGHYKSNDIENIIFLFNQMTQEEINRIKTESFDSLWNDLWKNDDGSENHGYKYHNSKALYHELKDGLADLNIDFYVNNVKPSFHTPEWGFPKGRKNENEEDIECAEREYMEETCYTHDDILILNNISPIKENMIGTDGKKYIHIYYIGISKKYDDPYIHHDISSQSNEVGDIAWFSYEDAFNNIRYYHKEKKIILTQIYSFIINTIVREVKKYN
jgi:ADP-ribose pyrophosphatase YjhB (NUDIX family)